MFSNGKKTNLKKRSFFKEYMLMTPGLDLIFLNRPSQMGHQVFLFGKKYLNTIMLAKKCDKDDL